MQIINFVDIIIILGSLLSIGKIFIPISGTSKFQMLYNIN